MRIGLLSDTHGYLDQAIFEYFAACDEIWHAGDFGSVEVLDRLKAFKPFRGVYGNIDGEQVRCEVPRALAWDCNGLRVYMTHIGGYPGRYEAGVKRDLAERRPGLFIAGHSHIVRVMRDRSLGLMHLNPGACGHKGLHAMRTLLRFAVTAGKLADVELIELGVRGHPPISPRK